MMNGIALSSSLLLAGGIIAFGFILSARGKSETHNFDELDEKITTKIIDADSLSYSLQYKQADSVTLDLTVFPSAKNPEEAPAIVFFFGGGWKEGTTEQFKPHAKYFVQRGMTGILVDYRVSTRHGTTPFDAVDDAREAVAFIIGHASELGIDKNKIVLAGGSVGGGQLTLMSSFLPKEKNTGKRVPAALVLFNPVIDTGPEGYGYKRLGESYKAISPINNIPDNPPPMIIFLGTADNIIDVQQAEDFCSAIKQDQDQCILKLYKDQKHGFFNYRNTRYFIQTVREADRFLIQQQLLKGTPNIKGWMQQRGRIGNQSNQHGDQAKVLELTMLLELFLTIGIEKKERNYVRSN